MTFASQYGPAGTVAIVGLAVTAVSVIALGAISVALDSAILIPTDKDSEAYKRWQRNDQPDAVPVYEHFTFSSITNRAAYESGSTPAVEEKGPYWFRVFNSKEDVEFTEGNTLVTYKDKKWYVFDESQSCSGCALTDEITTLNPAWQAVEDTVQQNAVEFLFLTAEDYKEFLLGMFAVKKWINGVSGDSRYTEFGDYDDTYSPSGDPEWSSTGLDFEMEYGATLNILTSGLAQSTSQAKRALVDTNPPGLGMLEPLGLAKFLNYRTDFAIAAVELTSIWGLDLLEAAQYLVFWVQLKDNMSIPYIAQQVNPAVDNGLVSTRSVYEWMFQYHDELAGRFNEPTFSGETSLLAGSNNTVSATTITLYTGVGYGGRAERVYQYNGKGEITYEFPDLSTTEHVIADEDATLGTRTFIRQPRPTAQSFSVFTPLFLRNLWFTGNLETSEVAGVPTNRFRFDPAVFDSSDPRNDKFKSDRDGTARLTGALMRAPLYLTKAHLLDSSATVLATGVVAPDPARDDSTVDTEPATGLTLALNLNIQVNIVVGPEPRRYPDVPDQHMMPFAVVGTSVSARESDVAGLASIQTILALLYAAIGVGSASAAGAMGFIAYKRYKLKGEDDDDVPAKTDPAASKSAAVFAGAAGAGAAGYASSGSAGNRRGGGGGSAGNRRGHGGSGSGGGRMTQASGLTVAGASAGGGSANRRRKRNGSKRRSRSRGSRNGRSASRSHGSRNA